jgi:transcriptional regulator with GAF, ATPase, and Fis domain
VGIEKRRADGLLDIVIPIGVQLSTEKNFSRLLENMLVEAKKFCNADAGTLYLVKGKQLDFSVVRNDTLRVALGGTTNQEITFPSLLLYDEAGKPNHSNIAAYAALSGKTVNIEDAYDTKDFDFSGTKVFDRTNGYQSVSFLTIPLKSNEGNVLGVLQLINALDSKREIVAFDKNLQQLMESFSSLACAALEGYIQEQSLRNEIKELRIEIDAVKRNTQVEEITNSAYFKNLQEKAKSLRNTGPRPDEKPVE